MDCIFCLIKDGKIPSKKVYEDDDVLAFLDISQATYGHTLVISKKHYSNLLEIEEEDYLKVMRVVRKLAKQICEKLGTDSVNILNNTNLLAGQTVNHFHVHIIPRYKDDDLKIEFKEHQENLDDILKKIGEF